MANVTTTITVRSSVGSHLPISGAQVFVDAIGRGPTDASGRLTLVLTSGTTYDLSIKATDYAPYSASSISANQASVLVDMNSTPPASTVSYNLTIQPEDVAVGISVIFDNGGNPVTALYAKGGTTVSGLTPGVQTVTGTVPNYNAINSTFEVSAGQSGTILLQTSDDGTAQAQQAVIKQDPDASSILPNLTIQQAPEFVAPNTGQGTYFTMTQARVYIGNLFIDELNSLQFALQDNKIPIYGYASRLYDAKAQGKSLVQGQFTLNFISEGYLYVALRAYDETIYRGEPLVDPVLAQQQARMLTLVNQLRNPDPAWTPAMFSSAKSEVRNLAASLGPTAVVKANAGISLTSRQQNNSLLGLPGTDYSNAVYQDISFDVVIEYTGAGRTITRRLEDCTLISNESIMDHSGTPILDSYGFIARRLR